MFIGTILLILLCQLFWVGGVQPGGVVLCILLFNTPVDTYISYALSRIFDTGVGVVAAWRSTACFPAGLPSEAEEYCANLEKKMEHFSGYHAAGREKGKHLPEDGEQSAE